MRRLVCLLTAGALALSAAAPAAAAPVQNPNVSMWEIVCPEPTGTYVVIAKTVPGWPTDFEHGTAPIHLRAATWYAWEGGEIVDGPYTLLPPPGWRRSSWVHA
jgi:hypothetical protein